MCCAHRHVSQFVDMPRGTETSSPALGLSPGPGLRPPALHRRGAQVADTERALHAQESMRVPPLLEIHRCLSPERVCWVGHWPGAGCHGCRPGLTFTGRATASLLLMQVCRTADRAKEISGREDVLIIYL